MAQVTVVDHPLVRCHLTSLRDSATPSAEFRLLVRRLAVLLTYEATATLAVEPRRVTTPLEAAEGCQLSQRIALVPILRAGLGMVDPILELIPTAEVWHLGLYRDETTAKPVEYYSKLPPTTPVDVALVLDPMLATGGSAVAALSAIATWGVRRSSLVSVIAAPEGVEEVARRFPETSIYVAAIDRELNQRKFIVPGLGDAGDRIFNTVPGS